MSSGSALTLALQDLRFDRRSDAPTACCGAKKTKQMSAQPKKGVLSWIPYEMHSTLKLMVEYLALTQPLLEQHGLNQLFKTK